MRHKKPEIALLTDKVRTLQPPLGLAVMDSLGVDFVMAIHNCPRCHDDHGPIPFQRFQGMDPDSRAPAVTHYAICWRTYQPILMQTQRLD